MEEHATWGCERSAGESIRRRAIRVPSFSKYLTSFERRSRSMVPEMPLSKTAGGSLTLTRRPVPAKMMALRRFSFSAFSLKAGAEEEARKGTKPTSDSAVKYSLRRLTTSRNVEREMKFCGETSAREIFAEGWSSRLLQTFEGLHSSDSEQRDKLRKP